MPDCRSGAEIMKMISSTSTTSTRLATLMSDRLRYVGGFRTLRTQRLFLQCREKFRDESRRDGVDPAETGPRIVEAHHGGNGGRQAHNGGDQRLGDAGRYDGQRSRSG